MPPELERLTDALTGRYTIEREIGSGGMATVYLADDLRHGRKVAIKVLRPELGAVLGGERFLREIHIAAGLNHPHILALHDSGEADGLLYYVMPWVEGESLRELLDRQTQLPIDEALELAGQVASALDYAHRQGVIHRDIKPENILLQDGQAVVADFGIARALRVAGGDRLTETGLSLGTPAYMSPEQASGAQELDARSDIYALGCVLFEMLAGDPPFTGATAPAIIARQLVDPVPSLRVVRPSVPEGLQGAIEKALAKVPADRYETAGKMVGAASTGAEVEGTGKVETARGRGSSKLWRVGVPLALVTAAILVGVALLLRSDWLGRGPLQFTVSNLTHVTSEPGLEFQPAISPDGQEVAYVVGPVGNPRIVVRSAIQVGSGETRPGLEASGSQWFPVWTADGAFLHFWACPPESRWARGSGCDWKEVGKFGGSVRSIGLPRTSHRVAWSRDGTRVAFPVHDSIFAASADGGEPELMGVHVADAYAPLHSLTWSPEGRRIAYVVGNSFWPVSVNALGSSMWILDAVGGEPVRVTDDTHLNVSPQWLPDGRHLLFVSNRDGPRGIYAVEVGADGPRGPARSVLSSSDAHSISISADGRRLAYAKLPPKQNIWSIPIPRSGSVSIRDATPVTTGNQVVESHSLSPSSDSIVYESTLRGNLDIYKRPLVGEGATLLADLPGHAFSPAWSPDGSEVAFHSIRPGGTGANIFVVPAAGGVARQLENMPGDDAYPEWSPDGLSIAFLSFPPGTLDTRVWVVSRDRVGGDWRAPSQLTDFRCGPPQWDPAGSSLVCPASDSLGRALVRISRDGEVLARYDYRLRGLVSFGSFGFSHDGTRIYGLGTHEDGSQGVWWMPVAGGELTKAVEFDDPSLSVPFALTVGTEHLYLTISEYESDIWVADLDW